MRSFFLLLVLAPFIAGLVAADASRVWAQQDPILDDQPLGGSQPPTDSSSGADDLTAELEEGAAETTAAERLGQLFTEGKELQAQQNWEAAIEKFTACMALDAGFSPALYERGVCFIELGRYDQAVASLSQAEFNAPIAAARDEQFADLPAKIYRDWGKAYYHMNDYRNARDPLSQAAIAAPADPETWYLTGATLLRLSLTTQPTYDSSQVVQYLYQAAVALDRALEYKSDYGEAYLERARVVARLGEVDDAIADIQKAIPLLSDNSTAVAELGMAYAQKAGTDLNKVEVNLNEIINSYRQAIQYFTEYLQAAGSERPRKPWETVDPLSIRPENVWLSRADTSVALANELPEAQRPELYQAAIRDAQTVLGMKVGSSELAQAYLRIGIAQRLLNQLPEAAESLSHAIETAGNVPDGEQFLGNILLRRGIVRYHQKDLKLARADFQQALTYLEGALFPAAVAYFWSGITYATEGDHHMAVYMYTRAVRNVRGYSIAHLNRGLSYMNLGRYERALEDFNEVLRRHPDHAKARHYRQMALDELSKTASR